MAQPNQGFAAAGRERVKREDIITTRTANFGDHTRTILSAMRLERPNPRELIGRRTLFVINLEPKAMAGVVSENMVLDLGYVDGLLPTLAISERPVPDGARAG
jgi:tRNA-binding protein